jgi:sugar phosphate isomerase/epimerase
MRLGGTVSGNWSSPAEWEELLLRSRFRAVTAPFSCNTPRNEIEAYCDICKRHDVLIAEIGVWKNLFDPDPAAAGAAMEYAMGQLALADELGIACCVNVAGTSGPAGWDAADPSNFTEETYARLVACIREILDRVNPKTAFYCLEPMPWMIPDSPESYLQLIRDVDRPQCAVHMDFINMINCPRRYLAAEQFIEDCFTQLGPLIKSTHIKDTRMDPMALTTVITECSPGEGCLDFHKVLRILDRHLPADAPVLLEHMTTFEEYSKAYDCLKAIALQDGLSV